MQINSNSSSGCGSVGRAVASVTRGPWFKSRHRQIFYRTFIYDCQLYCIEKTKIKEKEAGNGRFKKQEKIKQFLAVGTIIITIIIDPRGVKEQMISDRDLRPNVIAFTARTIRSSR